jgi:hypothetical protein
MPSTPWPHPVGAHVDDELVDAIVGEIEFVEIPAHPEITDVRRFIGIFIEPIVGKTQIGVIARIGMVIDAIHDDVDIPFMQLVDEDLKTAELDKRLRVVVIVVVFHREERYRVVTPAELATGPCGPRHEFNGIDTEPGQIVEPIQYRTERRPAGPVLRREIVEHQLIDDQPVERQPLSQLDYR